MSDDEEDYCPLCILPFTSHDADFTPCPCGFKICVWCWHKIIDIAGSVSENSLDQVGSCPHCRTPFDVEAVLEHQRKLAAERAKKGGKGATDPSQPAARAKRKAVPSKQAFADTVIVDGKTVSLENVPGIVFLPAVLPSLGEYLLAIDTPDNLARKFLLTKLEAIKEERRKKTQVQQQQKKLTKRQKKSLAEAEEQAGEEEDDGGLEGEVFTEDDSDCFEDGEETLAPAGPASTKPNLSPPIAASQIIKGRPVGYNSAAVGVSSRGALDGVDVPEAAHFNRVAALCLSRKELSQGEAISEASSKLAHDPLPLPLMRCLRDVRAVLRALLTHDRHAEEVGKILTGEALLPTFTSVIAKPAMDDELRKLLEDDAIQRNVHARSASVAAAGSNTNVSSRVSGSQETSVSLILQDITNMAIYHPHLLASSTTDVLYYNNPFFDRCWAKVFLREDAADDTKTAPAASAGNSGSSTAPRRPLATKAAPMPLDGAFNDVGDGAVANGSTNTAPSPATNDAKAVDGVASLRDDEVAALATILAPYDLSYLEENIDALATQASRQWVKGTNNAVDLKGVMIDCDGHVGSNNSNVTANANNRTLLNNAYFNAKARLLLERRRMNYRMWVRLCFQAACSAHSYAASLSESAPHSGLNYETLQLVLRTLMSFSTAAVGVDGKDTATTPPQSVVPAAPSVGLKQTAIWTDALLRTQEHTASLPRLLLFGKVLCHYVSRKETTFLTHSERLELLQQQSMIGRFGHVTDGQFLAVAGTSASPTPQPASPATEEAPSTAAAHKVAKAISDAFYDSVNTADLLPSTGTLIQCYHRFSYGGYIRQFFEDLNRCGAPKSATNVTTAILSMLPISGYGSSSESGAISHVLPAQRYTVILRFSSVAEAVACVASGVEHAFQEGIVPALATGSTSSAATDGLFRLAASSTLHAPSTFSRVKVGLVPTRYCSQFLKHSMCEKSFCTELHQELQFTPQTTVSSSSPKTIIAAIQDHFFAGAMAAVAASSMGSFRRQSSTTDLSHISNQSPLGFGGVAGSTVTGPPVVRGVPAGSLVGSSQPLLLKSIKAAEFSVLRNDFVAPAPDHITVDHVVPTPPTTLRVTELGRLFEAEKAKLTHRFIYAMIAKYQQQLSQAFKALEPESTLPVASLVPRGTGKVLMLEKADKNAWGAAAAVAASGPPSDAAQDALPTMMMPSLLLCNPNSDGYAHDKGCLSPVAKGGYNYMDPTLPSEFGHSAALPHTLPAWSLTLAADLLSESEKLLGKFESYLASATAEAVAADGVSEDALHGNQKPPRSFIEMTILLLGRHLGLDRAGQSKQLLAHFWDKLASLAAAFRDSGSLPPSASKKPPTNGAKNINMTNHAKRQPTAVTEVYSQPLLGEDLNQSYLKALSAVLEERSRPGANDVFIADNQVDPQNLAEGLCESLATLSTLLVVARQHITDSFLRELPTLATSYYTVAGDSRIRGVAAARGMIPANIEKLIARMVVLNQGTLLFLGKLSAVVQQLVDVSIKIKACFNQSQLIQYLVPLERARALAGVASGVAGQPDDLGDGIVATGGCGGASKMLGHSMSGSLQTPVTAAGPNSKQNNPWGKAPSNLVPPSPLVGLNDSGSGFPPTPVSAGSWGPTPVHDDPWSSYSPKQQQKAGSGVWGEPAKARAPESMADKLAKKFGTPNHHINGPPNPVGNSGTSTPNSLEMVGAPSKRVSDPVGFGGIQPIDSCLDDDDDKFNSQTDMLKSRSESNIYGANSSSHSAAKRRTSANNLSSSNLAAHEASAHFHPLTAVNAVEMVAQVPTGVKAATQTLVGMGSQVLVAVHALRQLLIARHTEYRKAVSLASTSSASSGSYADVVRSWMGTLAASEDDTTMHNIFVPALRIMFRKYLAFDLLRHAAVAAPTTMNLVAVQLIERGLLATQAPSSQSSALVAMFGVAMQCAVAESTNRLDMDRNGAHYYGRNLHRDGQFSTGMLARLQQKGVASIRSRCFEGAPSIKGTAASVNEAEQGAKRLVGLDGAASTLALGAPMLLTLFHDLEGSPSNANPNTINTTLPPPSIPPPKGFADSVSMSSVPQPTPASSAAATRRPAANNHPTSRGGRGSGGARF